MKTFILVPVYNEGEAFRKWLPGLLRVAKDLGAVVVIVDDGSDEVGVRDFSTSALRLPLCYGRGRRSGPSVGMTKILRHQVNCGVGAAVGTGLEYARRNGAEMVLTIDGDGQHDPADLHLLFEELKKNANQKVRDPMTPSERTFVRAGNVQRKKGIIINGSRFLKKQSVPFLRRVANFLANIITYCLSGFWLSDSQSGMKGFSQKALEQVSIMTPGYEWCTDIFREANWYGFRVQEVPISVSYSLYSLSKGQSFAIGLDMVMRLMVRSLMR